MKRRRHTPEQIVRKLREADRLLAEGGAIPEVAKKLEVSEATYHRWWARYGGLKADNAKRPSIARSPVPPRRSTACTRPRSRTEQRSRWSAACTG